MQTPSIKIDLKKAVREQIKLRVALIGPSGSGKTYSALRLAAGMAKKTEKPTLLLDTENGRGKIYANEFDYYYEPFVQPFSPERYIEYIRAAEEAGVGQLIVDGCSAEWKYLLSQLGVLKQTSSGTNKNEFASWDKITPRHDAFVSSVIYSGIHLILLMRGKDEYKMEEKNGKNVPKKIGVGPIMRDGLEYECNVAFTIDLEGHLATQSKDDTHYFQDMIRPLEEKDGEFLIDWARDGIEAQPAQKLQSAPPPKAAPKLTRAQVESRLRAVKSLDELASIWDEMKSAIQDLSDQDREDVKITKNLVKAKLTDPPPPPAQAPTAQAPPSAPPSVVAATAAQPAADRKSVV